MKRKNKLSAGQKKRRQRKIETKVEKIRGSKHEILFRKFGRGNGSLELTNKIEGKYVDHPVHGVILFVPPSFDESIIADWHAYRVRMKNLLFLKF